jgi:hypothetical protein
MAGRNGRSCGFAKSMTLMYALDEGARDDVDSQRRSVAGERNR